MKRKSQKITGTNSRYHFPTNYPQDRGHFKLRELTNVTLSFKPARAWDEKSFVGPLAGFVVPLCNPGSLFTTNTFNDGNMCNIETLTGNNYPGDDVIGQIYDYVYVSSVGLSWKVTRSDDSSDYPIHFLMAPVSTSQLSYFGSVNPSAGKRLYWPGPSSVPDDHSWSNSRILHGAVHNKVNSIKCGPSTRSVSMQIPMKKYAYPGFPTALPDVKVTSGKTNSWMMKTNGNGVQGWNTPDDAHQIFLYLAIYCPIDVGPDLRLSFEFRTTWYLTACMPRIPSRVFWGYTDDSGGGSGATGPSGEPVYPPSGPTGDTGLFSLSSLPPLTSLSVPSLSYPSSHPSSHPLSLSSRSSKPKTESLLSMMLH